MRNFHFALAAVAFLLLSPASMAAPATNVTAIISAFPDLSSFAHLLSSTRVASELSSRSSLTILAVPNSFLLRSPLPSDADVADVLRYHVLLEYLSPSDLRRLPPSGKLVTTLYQTTGRAAGDIGAINITKSSVDGESFLLRTPAPFSSSNATILGPVVSSPYNLSIFAVSAFIFPYDFDLAASEARPPAPINITKVLTDAHNFNVVSSMLLASGVVEEFEDDERGAGITVFAPTDDAFAALPTTERLQSLPAEEKAAVLRFHVLHSYYPLGSLESILNPLQPTLATESTAAGRFTLNITRVNGSVAIDTGIVQASITRTVFDQNPVAVFAVPKVLLPLEMFGGHGEKKGVAVAAPPFPALAPETSEDSPPETLSSPPGSTAIADSSNSAAAGAMSPHIVLLLAIAHGMRILR